MNFNLNLISFSRFTENDYPYEDGTQQQEELNRALAGYLRREEEREHAPNQWAGYEEGEDEDLYGFDARKRSMAYQPRHGEFFLSTVSDGDNLGYI